MGTIESRYVANTPRSAAADGRAGKAIVGSNSRGAAWWRPYPITVARADGVYVEDVDGRTYIDAINNYTSLVHGHGYPPIIQAVSKQLAMGTAFTANNNHQIALAERLIDRIPSMDSVRFTNSGSEAGLLALTIARIVTGRSKVLMARGGYHGILMEFEAGSMPELMAGHDASTFLGNFNDAASFEAILDAHGDDIAAVVLEPVLGAGGIVPATPEFLRRVQAAARSAGALLVLDEVITFRLAEGGAQSLLGIEPDLTMLGKIIGGGFPVGAVGGRQALMDIFDPGQPKAFHSGTYSGNPITMTAGLASVEALTETRIKRMTSLATRLADGIERHASNLDLPVACGCEGSLLQLRFERGDGLDRMASFHLAALNHGLLLAPRGMMALSTLMDEALIDEMVQRAAQALQDVADEPDLESA